MSVGDVEKSQRRYRFVDVGGVQAWQKHPFADPPFVNATHQCNGRSVECLDVFALGHVTATVEVLGHHHADVVFVFQVVVKGHRGQAPHGLNRRHVVELNAQLGVANLLVRGFKRGHVQAFLALEVVVNHALAGAGGRRNGIHPSTRQALFTKLSDGRQQDVGLDRLGVAGTLSRFFVYHLVHKDEICSAGFGFSLVFARLAASIAPNQFLYWLVHKENPTCYYLHAITSARWNTHLNSLGDSACVFHPFVAHS